jgi:hypothetical protein
VVGGGGKVDGEGVGLDRQAVGGHGKLGADQGLDPLAGALVEAAHGLDGGGEAHGGVDELDDGVRAGLVGGEVEGLGFIAAGRQDPGEVHGIQGLGVPIRIRVLPLLRMRGHGEVHALMALVRHHAAAGCWVGVCGRSRVGRAERDGGRWCGGCVSW